MPKAKNIPEIALERWSEFHERLALLDEERNKRQNASDLHVSQLLFRGQADARWALSSTLEREVAGEFRAEEYYRRALVVSREIEAFTGKSWDLPNPSQFAQILNSGPPSPEPLSVYEYFVHLRHHGFPSPLLDWSSSPYIAAFFAFRDPPADADRSAIFCYLGYAGDGRSSSPALPSVYDLGPTLRTHARHFVQRCEYTYCMVKRDPDVFYASHEAAFSCFADHEQDLLWKITLPRSQRVDALRWLDRVNISAYSLFRSEDALAESLALREFHFRG